MGYIIGCYFLYPQWRTNKPFAYVCICILNGEVTSRPQTTGIALNEARAVHVEVRLASALGAPHFRGSACCPAASPARPAQLSPQLASPPKGEPAVLVTDEPVEFEKYPVEVEGKLPTILEEFIDYYTNLIKENRRFIEL